MLTLTVYLAKNGQKIRRPFLLNVHVGDDIIFVVVKACQYKRTMRHKRTAGEKASLRDFLIV